MQEVFEKIISRIDNKQNGMKNSNEVYTMGEYEGLTIAKKIVEQEAEKYNNGWIPCSERMPVEHDSIFAKFKGTEKWKKAMFEKMSSVVNVTVVGEKGHVTTTQASTIDGKWSCDLLRFNKEYQIIAWQPLPEPYQPKGEQIDYKPTNAERIRHMSDEKLAELITSGELCAICPFCKYYGTESCYMENEGVHKNCAEGIIGWLQSKAEE